MPRYPDHIQAFFDLYNAMANLYHALPFGPDCDLAGAYEPDQVEAIERGRRQLHKATKMRDQIVKAWKEAEGDALSYMRGVPPRGSPLAMTPENAGKVAGAIRKGIGCKCPDGLARDPLCPVHGKK